MNVYTHITEEVGKRSQRGPKLGKNTPIQPRRENREILRSPRRAPQAIFGSGAQVQLSQVPEKQEQEGCLSISTFGLGDRMSPSSPRVCPKMAKGQNKGKMVKF